MKQTFILTILIFTSFLIYGQSPITAFEEKINYWTCSYVVAEFHYISSNSAERDSVCWDFGDGNKGCNSYTNGASHIYSEPGVYTVTLTIWLKGVKTQIEKKDLITVYKAPEAMFSYTVSDTNLIAPLRVDFQNQSVKGDGDTLIYTWTTGFFSTSLSSDTNFSYTFKNAGTYFTRLILNDNNGCQVAHSEVIVVKDSLQINEFDYITSSCNYSDTCSAGAYYKIKNDTLILFGQVERNCCTHNTAVIIDKLDTIQIPTFESGQECDCNCLFCFEINIPDFHRDSCVIVFDNQIIKVNSKVNTISNQKLLKDIGIKPNPFNESIKIDIENMNGNNYSAEIFNIQGQLIKSQSIYNQSTDIDLKNIAKGIYLVKVTGNGAVLKSEKLIKE